MKLEIVMPSNQIFSPKRNPNSSWAAVITNSRSAATVRRHRPTLSCTCWFSCSKVFAFSTFLSLFIYFELHLVSLIWVSLCVCLFVSNESLSCIWLSFLALPLDTGCNLFVSNISFISLPVLSTETLRV